MAATKGEHAIQIPDTLAPEAQDGIVQDPAAAKERLGPCCKAMLWVGCALVFAFVVVTIIMGAIVAALDAPANYSAALAAAAVSPDKQAPTTAIPALFELTVHIKNPSKMSSNCVWSDAAATVSRGGSEATIIGAGTVPWFCAGKRKEREATVPVWGVGAGADVALPRALQSCGAVVDVELRMPSSAACKHRQVLTCSVKVGGGLSPCTSSCDY